ncbi:MAG: hypothetical protein M9884_13450 [Rhodocyclaceae bacterium]|nr:hypothetical protein [Rhodocyclaceae bacterium]
MTSIAAGTGLDLRAAPPQLASANWPLRTRRAKAEPVTLVRSADVPEQGIVADVGRLQAAQTQLRPQRKVSRHRTARGNRGERLRDGADNPASCRSSRRRC